VNRRAEIVLIPAQMGPKLSGLGEVALGEVAGSGVMAGCRIMACWITACRLWPQHTDALKLSTVIDTKRRLLRG
jgi:hypothetical protein